jgi:hypothetical protein
VKGLKKNGVRMGNWLTDEQARSLWQSPDHARMKGKRDGALLALLLVECPANFEPVCMRETGAKGAGDGTRKEAYA